MAKCYICGKEAKRLAKHITEAHPEEAKLQEELVLKYYKEGLSARKIANKPDVMYSGGTSVVRVLKKHFTPEELEAGRRERIGSTTAESYAKGERDWVSEINSARAKSKEGREKNSIGLKKAYATGKKVAWRKGKSKLTDKRINEASKKTSQTMREKARKGELKTLLLPGENNALWKEDCESVARRYRNNLDFSKKQREQLLKESGFKCAYCGVSSSLLEVEKKIMGYNRLSLECDHIIPIEKGGSKDIVNGQILCSRCHIFKSFKEKFGKDESSIEKYLSDPIRVINHIYNGNADSKLTTTIHGYKVGIFPLFSSYCKDKFLLDDFNKDGGFSFYSDEWYSKRDIVLSMISQRLGQISNRLYARKCVVQEVAAADRRAFFKANHLSGDVNANKAWGLCHKGKLVSLISLRKPFTKKHADSIEIARFASSKDTIVVGGLSKLMKVVREWSLANGYEKILTYADLRIGQGESYKKVGFVFDGRTPLNYFYTDGFKRYNRFKFRAQNGMTEKQYAASKGVHKIYGPGSNRYILDLK